MPDAEFSVAALAAPTMQLRSQIVTRLVPGLINLSALQSMSVAAHVDDSPRVTSAPQQVERAIAGADGNTYFVPQARIAERSKATGAPHVFLAKSAGVVTLQVWFDLVLFPSLPTGSSPLPVDHHSVALVPLSGDPIVFERCDLLPRGDRPEEVLARLYCETPVDPNTVVPMLETPGTRFRVEGDVHYTIEEGGSGVPEVEGVWPRLGGRLRVLESPVGPLLRMRLPVQPEPSAPALGGGMVSRFVRDHRAGAVIRDHRTPPPVGPASAAQWVSKTARLSLGAADNGGVAACFPRDVMSNRAIYAQVTSGFGSEPWSEWVDSPEGAFMDSPVPDQFYMLPDEYRVGFDADTKQPALMVLLVPPKRQEGTETPASFGADYTLRTKFSVVPWVDPARRERLRGEIARHARVPYPDLVVGGIREATCELSSVFHELGSSLVGADTGSVKVDGAGFDLVLDCTSEFYATLTHLLVTEGVEAEVTATLVSPAESPRVASVPVRLRLDRPASDVLSAALVPPAPAADAGAEPPAETAATPAQPVLRVSNPLPYAVSVSRTVARLLVVDESLPSPIGSVAATAEPSAFRLPPAAEAPSTVDVVLTAEPSAQPAVFGSAGVTFEGIDVEIDPQQVLAKAYDTGTAGSVSSSVDVRCYQLEHPESRPPALADVFGLEVQLRRSEESAPVTVFLTTDQPRVEVQISFSLKDIVAGMRPEQPTFEWRRRNMAGSGTGDWSEWASITGRQLFVSPVGM